MCYGITEFCKAPKGKGDETYMSANEIAVYVKSHWHRIGDAAVQANLCQAQAYANAGRPVIAVRPELDHGHVCLVLPGKLVHSRKWGLDVPNSASFRLDDIRGCYIGKPLSWSFGADKKSTVGLYAKMASQTN